MIGWMMSKRIACVTDPSSHGGFVVNSNQDNTLLIGDGGAFGSQVFGAGSFGAGIPAVNGAQHSCPIEGHGVTSITAVTTKSKHNSKLILTENAVAGCGALLTPGDRKVNVE